MAVFCNYNLNGTTMTTDTWVTLITEGLPTVVGLGALVLAHFHVKTNAQTQTDMVKTLGDLLATTHGKVVDHLDTLFSDTRALIADFRAANQPTQSPPKPAA